MKNRTGTLQRTLLLLLALILILPGLAGRTRAAAQEYVPDLTPVQYCGDYAYKVCNDSSVEIVEYKGLEPDIIIPEELDGNRVTSIGDEAFAYYKMDSLIVPEGISIGGRAFEYCVVRKVFSLPAGVVIRNRAFEYAELPKAVVIPEGALLEGDCFSYCEDLERLFVEPSAILRGSAFSYSEDLKTLVCAPGSEISARAFEYSYDLAGVLLCGDVTLGDDPFPYCRRARLLSESAEQYELEIAKYPGIRPAQRSSGGSKAPSGTTGGKTSGQVIGEAAALEIALTHAELDESRVRDLDVELKQRLRGSYYEVEFESGFYDYEYRIDAFTGEILSSRRER